MKVSEAVELLTKYNKPDDDILFAYWDKEATGQEDLTNEEWAKMIKIVDEMDGLLEPVSWAIETAYSEIIKENS